MAALNSTGLREHSHLYLQELRQRTSYTVSLAVLDGTDILYVGPRAQLPPRQGTIDLNLQRVRACRPTGTAMGKLLLAHLPEAEQRDVFAAIKLSKRAPTRSRPRRRCMTSSTRCGRRALRSTTRSSPPSC